MIKKEFEQKRLPLFGDIVPQARERRYPQPRAISAYPPDVNELFAVPLNLNFRKRLGIWVNRMEKEGSFSVEEILVSERASLVRQYLFPQKDRWLNQEEVVAQVYGDPKSKGFKEKLLISMVRIIRRHRNGPRAIEILKNTDFLYKHLVFHKLPSGKKLETIDELKNCSSEELRLICGARRMFEDLKRRLREYFPDWDPQVVFREELPPEQAFDL